MIRLTHWWQRAVDFVYVCLQGCTKDLARALTHKAEGNNSYSKGDFATATQQYSGRIINLPCLVEGGWLLLLPLLPAAAQPCINCCRGQVFEWCYEAGNLTPL